MKKHYSVILTIAGSDCSGGAGIQADIKTISANGGYAASVITALTAQNTVGVQQIYALPGTFIHAQLKAVFSDIKINAVKIGMLHDTEAVRCVKNTLKYYRPKHVVLDPVMVAKGGEKLIKAKVARQMMADLFPLTTLITPNIPEAEILYGQKISSKHDMFSAAKTLASLYKINVLLKGGHLNEEECCDILYCWKNKKALWFSSQRIHTQNTHGTGCSLSSAIATFLAKGHTLVSAMSHAKKYVSRAIAAGKECRLGKGHGPINHFFI